MSAVTTFSRTAANNNSAAPNGAPEGWAPSAVNDTIRELMKAIVDEATNGAAKVLASVAGTNTITATATPDITAYSAGMILVFTPAATNTAAATINIDSLGALDILTTDGAAIRSGDLVSGVPAVIALDSGADDFILLNPQSQVLSSKGLSGQNIQSGNYTLVLADAGRNVHYASGSGNTYTIPANSSVAYPLGTTILVTNVSGNNLTIAITTDTLSLAGAGTTGSRTLNGNGGMATLYKYASTAWLISGSGVS